MLGRKARERVLYRYTLEGNVSCLENLYASLTQEKQLAYSSGV
jgi:hypothetical protein